ncbi:MAG: acyl-CoA dehydrogenase family protein [Proteobacteria bacterium]|nr:acyl-CoA dehydrogenase family protein [Pseudomonadota bacterium]
MDFDFNDEQRMLQETVRRYMRDRIVPIADEYDARGPLNREDTLGFMRDLKPFGYVATLVGEDQGGPGLSHVDWALLHEELRGAYASLGGAVGIAASTAHAVSQSENTALRDRILPGLVSGEKLACTAITEPNVGSNAAGIETRAELDGDHYVINGAKMWISNGTISDYVSVVASLDRAKGPRGICQILVEREVSPFEAREIPKMGVKSFPTAELVFEDCRVPKENLLRAPGAGFKNALRFLTFARCNAAIASVGMAQAAVNAAVRYARERTQFGRPIGQFQLIQAKIADMQAETDAARLLAYRAFFLLDRGRSAQKEASIAKFYATEAGWRVASQALQIHGAYGLSREYPVERLFRDARCYTIPDGTTEIQKLIVGREVLGLNAFV